MKLLEHGPDITWLGHDGFKIKGDRLVYIDPYQVEKNEPGDIVLLTHDHFDHCVPKDVDKVSGPQTTIVAPAECAAKFPHRQITTIKPGDTITVKGVQIEAVPAYNINKFRSPGQPFHPRDDNKVGYVITLNGVRVYHAGDSDATPELRNVRCDIALIPVSGTYVMTAEEAAEAVNAMKPQVAVPMHFGALVGNASDAERFQRQCQVPVTILEQEG